GLAHPYSKCSRFHPVAPDGSIGPHQGGRKRTPACAGSSRSHGGRMADTRDVIIADPSAVPLPPPSLATGEDAAGYAQLAAHIRAAVAPANIIEEIWARDVADLTWDVVRLRRLKAGLFTIGAGGR